MKSREKISQKSVLRKKTVERRRKKIQWLFISEKITVILVVIVDLLAQFRKFCPFLCKFRWGSSMRFSLDLTGYPRCNISGEDLVEVLAGIGR